MDELHNRTGFRLLGCSPFDLIQHEAEELQREEAEGVRLAYVAATRARDLLIVPATGDEERRGWIEPINRAIYPPIESRRQRVRAPGCPEFRSNDSVLIRPVGAASSVTVSPGLHVFGDNHSVVWWDPRELKLGAEPPLGIRRSELIVKGVAPSIVEAGLADYESWRAANNAAVASGASPSIATRTVTQWARIPQRERSELPSIEIINVARKSSRPSGARFGTLVHAVLGTVPLDGDEDAVRRLTGLHGRILGATEQEVQSATEIVRTLLVQPVISRASKAELVGALRREVPIAIRSEENALVEGVIDLAFEEPTGWTIVDFKTDEELKKTEQIYYRQIGLYVTAVQIATGLPVSGVLMRL